MCVYIYIYTYNELISIIHLCFCILPCTLVIVCEDVVKMLPVPSSCAGDTTDTSQSPSDVRCHGPSRLLTDRADVVSCERRQFPKWPNILLWNSVDQTIGCLYCLYFHSKV